MGDARVTPMAAKEYCMSRTLSVVLTIAFALWLSAISFAATTVTKFAVGTCEPNLQSFTTISDAVQQVPSGSTVLVCPGNYPEQVKITQPLTLQGVRIGGNNAAVVTVPTGGLKQTVTDHFGNTFAYQVLVQNPTGPTGPGPVNIINLGVDGVNGSVNSGYLVGIYYQDASGTLTDIVARNQVSGINTGVGVLADSFLSAQTVTIQNSAVHGFDGIGMSARTDNITPTLTATIKGNTIRGGSSLPSGLTIGGVATGVVQSNAISDVSQGLGLIRSAVPTISGNTIYGANTVGSTVLIDGGSNTLRGNRIEAGGGNALQFFNSLGAPQSNTVQSNTIVDSAEAVVGCALSVSGNTVTGNTIIDALEGIAMLPGNTILPNTYFIVNTEVVPCS